MPCFEQLEVGDWYPARPHTQDRAFVSVWLSIDNGFLGGVNGSIYASPLRRSMVAQIAVGFAAKQVAFEPGRGFEKMFPRRLLRSGAACGHPSKKSSRSTAE